MKRRFSMRWMPLWETDGMKMMPFLSVAKYDWHYSDAGMEMLRLFRSELFLFLLKTHQDNVHFSLLADVHRDSEHRIWPYQIHRVHAAAGCRLFPGSALNTPSKKGMII